FEAADELRAHSTRSDWTFAHKSTDSCRLFDTSARLIIGHVAGPVTKRVNSRWVDQAGDTMRSRWNVENSGDREPPPAELKSSNGIVVECARDSRLRPRGASRIRCR